MTPEEQQAFEDKIYAYVGQQVCPRTPSKDPINDTMIRHWAEVLGEKNPAYTDAQWAATSKCECDVSTSQVGASRRLRNARSKRASY